MCWLLAILNWIYSDNLIPRPIMFYTGEIAWACLTRSTFLGGGSPQCLHLRVSTSLTSDMIVSRKLIELG